MSETAFSALLSQCQAFHARTPALREFADWPADLTFCEQPHEPIPAMRQILNWDHDGALHHAVQGAAPFAKWKRTYCEDEVGYGFLQDYGYLELYGADGHFYSTQARAFIAYWGRGLYYPWHAHEAEEIYAIISGAAYFESDGQVPAVLTDGQTRFHRARQPHAMTTKDSPILALVMWRGGGIDGLPAMETSR